MGTIKAEIELVNPYDLVLQDEGKKKSEEVRKMKITALVDTGAYMLCINHSINKQLGLRHIGYQNAELGDGSVTTIEVVGPVTINFKNRNTACRALVLPGNAQPLLGSIPMEDLDVVLQPLKQTIDINPDHPIIAQTILK
ncbi:MAG: clan AA aspartic protease [Chitinophagales bacterium]|nr:clan AA aspartic protease [Chitinophagales bacterium]